MFGESETVREAPTTTAMITMMMMMMMMMTVRVCLPYFYPVMMIVIFFCDSSSSSSGSKKVVSGPGTMPSPFFFSQTQPSRSKAKIASVRASRRRRCWSAEGFPKRRRKSSWSRARPLKWEGASVTGPGVWEILVEAGTHLIKDIFFGPRLADPSQTWEKESRKCFRVLFQICGSRLSEICS